MHPPGEHFIWQIALEAKIGPHILIQRCRIWPDNRRQTRVLLGRFTNRIAVNASEPAIQPPNSALARSQQFLHKTMILDAKIAALDILSRQASIGRQSANNLRPLGIGQRSTLQQGCRIFAKRKGFDLIQQFAEWLAL